MATLLAVPVTDATTHLLSSSRESTKRKSSETVMSKPVGQALSPNSPDTAVLGSPSSSVSTTNTDLNDHPMDSNGNGSNSNLAGFRIPKIKRVSPPTSSSSSAASESISTSMQPTMANDEAQNRAGKRKFSLSQYKEHKRLRSTEPMDPSLGDVDMRIQPKPPSPSVINNDTTVPSTNAQGLSPKAIEISQIAAKKSNLSEPGAKKTLKKKVIWADEKQQALVQTSFFEIDETERAHMHRFARDNMNSVPIAKLEQLLERDLRQHPNGPDRDDRSALPPLPPLIPILLPSSIPRPTVNSRQRIIQGEREQTVLQALFIRSLLPENPREPDGDSTDTSTTETILIPLEHDSADHSTAEVAPVVNSTNEKPAPIVSTNANESPNVTSTSLFPEVAQILAAAREKATSAMINAQPPTLTPPVVNPPLTLPTINNPALPFQITPNILSLLFNGAQGPVVPTPPPVNPLANLLSNIPFPLTLNPPPSNSSVNPLLTNPFNMPLPTTNNQQPSPLTFNSLSAASQVVSTSTSTPSTTTPNTTTTATTASSNGSPTYFDHSRNQKPFRFNHHNNGNNNNNNNGNNNNNNNNSDHHRHNQKSFSNPRGHHFRPGQNHHNRHKQFHNRNGFS